MSQNSINQQVVHWRVEELDNGITIENEETLAKEAAVEVSAPDSNENIKRLLGEWFYNDLKNAFLQIEAVKVRVTLQFEEDL